MSVLFILISTPPSNPSAFIKGKSKTSHYAIATGFMALGMMLPGMISGYIQQWLGYDGFFVWVVIAALPALLLLKFISYPADFGKKTTVPNE